MLAYNIIDDITNKKVINLKKQKHLELEIFSQQSQNKSIIDFNQTSFRIAQNLIRHLTYYKDYKHKIKTKNLNKRL